MVVFVVVGQKDNGIVYGVFSTMQKAVDCSTDHPYTACVILERTLDKSE